MLRLRPALLVIFGFMHLILYVALPSQSLGRDWAIRSKPRGTLTVVDLSIEPWTSIVFCYSEALMAQDKDNNWVPCLAEDWRWIDDHTIEFRLRKGVTFHNGEEFNADAVKVNWEAYRKMVNPTQFRLKGYPIPDETQFTVIDQFTVRFRFPDPNGVFFVTFWGFRQFAPSFFLEHKFEEQNWGFLPEAGPWGTGPFILTEGSNLYARPSERVVLEAYDNYWDRRYPKVQKVIFDNSLIANRKEAIRRCTEAEGGVDIVSFIRPLDTLKVAESRFAKLIKSKDVAYLRIIFNLRKKNSKWKDIRLRKALNFAINREELLRYAAKGNAYNLGGLIPAGQFGHNPDLELYGYDTSKAKSLLAEAGYPNGFKAKIITLEAWELETQIIRRMLERIGIIAEIEVLSTPAFYQRIYTPALDKPAEEQEWDLHTFALHDFFGHTGFAFLPWNYIDESDVRWIEYDSIYEEMWNDMVSTMDRAAQEEKIRQMVKYLYENAYALFIYAPISLYAVNECVDFVPYKHSFLNLKEAEVSEDHWSVRGKNN